MSSFGKAESVQSVKDGQHSGTIVDVQLRETEKWGVYADFIVSEDVTDSKIKFSLPVPEVLSEKTQVGQLIKNLLKEFVVGKEYKPEQLLGKRVSFLTTTNQNGYYEVVKQLNKEFAIKSAD